MPEKDGQAEKQLKKVIIKDVNLASINSSKDFRELKAEEISLIRDEILREALLKFSTESFMILRIDHSTFIMSGIYSMTSELYSALMYYFFKVEAFTPEEMEKYSIINIDLNQRHLYMMADELLVFNPDKFLSVVKKVITDDLEDFQLISIVRNGLLKAMHNLN